MNTSDPVTVEKATDSSGPDQSRVKTRILTMEEMFARVRARSRITRGRFRAELRRAVKDGLVTITGVPGKGVCVVLTDNGMLAMGEELGK